MVSDHWADILTAREHELDDHPPVLHQVSVEVDLLVVLRDQFHVRQMYAETDSVARFQAGPSLAPHESTVADNVATTCIDGVSPSGGQLARPLILRLSDTQ